MNIRKKLDDRKWRRNRDAEAARGSTTDLENWPNRIAGYLSYFYEETRIPSPWGWLACPSAIEAAAQVKDFFGEMHYGIETTREVKSIIDLGGNIGISAIYFAIRYPNAIVEVYEANPDLAKIIHENCVRAGIESRVIVHAKAVTTYNGTLTFSSSGDDKGKISDHGMMVPAVDINDVINPAPDIVKMDIEGAEFECIDRLDETGMLATIPAFVGEIHLENDDALRLAKIIQSFDKHGFKVACRSEFGDYTGAANAKAPFQLVSDKKMFAHIYAWNSKLENMP